MASEVVVPWATLLTALLLTGRPTSWLVLRHVVTIVHEAGHAAVAVLAGRRLQGIRLHSDTSGVTVSRGRARGPGMVLSTAAGYPAPSLLGLGLAGLLATGRTDAVLWVCLVGLLALVTQVRNLFGVLSVLLAGGCVAGVIWSATPWVSQAFGAGLCWLLLLGGLRAVVELKRTRRRTRCGTSDADQLAGLTGLGGLFWVATFGLICAGCLGASGWLLLGPAP